MTLEPFLASSGVIQIHAIAAATAFLTGIVQFARPKGKTVHRVLGWLWVLAMFVVCLTSFWIHEIRLIGDFSPIHLLSVLVLAQLPLAVRAARAHRVSAHSRFMKGMFFYGLIVAGLFTFFPGRLNFEWLLRPFFS